MEDIYTKRKKYPVFIIFLINNRFSLISCFLMKLGIGCLRAKKAEFQDLITMKQLYYKYKQNLY